jgi:anti-sigma regulatory factor (Ser/Thr protein kinase)
MPMIFSERYPASAASVPAARHDVTDALTAAGFSDQDLQYRVAQALSEATGNVVQHAYPDGLGDRHMEVVINETGGTLVIAVTDYGVGMNGADPRSGLPSMGLGLPLMRAETTNVDI